MNIFCSGIGGIGLSAYASHMRSKGHAVSGSDRADSLLLTDLRSQGITISLKQDGSAVAEALDLFVYSEAIPVDSPERRVAQGRGVRQISYFQALGELTAGKNLIAVCGTHGKSSTTAMISLLLTEAGKNPNVVVGTKLKELNGRNWRASPENLWVVEACEYRRSFHFLSPKIVLLTNADGDHFDAFSSAQEYEQAFVDFLKQLPEDGTVILHERDPQSVGIAECSGKQWIGADSEPLIDLKTPGLHMQQNAQLVLALAGKLGIDSARAESILREYAGSWRRMEVKGETASDVRVIDDYGHHPVEIRATLRAMREAYPDQRIVCVFQPHTHDRTLKLWDAFAGAFTDADAVIITNIYDARPDTEREMADVAKLTSAIERGSRTHAIDGVSLAHTETILREKILRKGDVLVVMGAGDVEWLAERMVRQ